MKILLLHSDFIEWEPRKKAISKAESVEKAPVKVKDCLVVFIAVEKPDEKDVGKVAGKAVKEVLDVAGQVKAGNVVLYPYVHLSHQPSNPDAALKAMDIMEERLKKKKLKVSRAPFGWYKAFNIKVKGHPLSELSRDITPEGKPCKDDVPEALKNEKKLKSEFYVFTPDGKKARIGVQGKNVIGFDFSRYPNFEKMVRYELMKDRGVDKEPPHISIMKRLELIDYEPGSDPGNLRYYPKGKFIKDLIETWITQKTTGYGAMEVETPIMYDYEHPSLKKYLNRFPARQYTIETPNKRVFLRFSACFGQFLIKHDANISYRNMPLKLYELSRYSFRVEQRGELAGLRRLRAFTMPDCHAACRDMEEAKSELLTRFKLCEDTLKGVDLGKKDMELAIRVVKDFYDENRSYIHDLVKRMGKPVLVEIWDKRFFYFVFKHEWNFVDAMDKAATLSTDQIDVENAERYDIKFTDSDGKRKHPIILHCSPSGAVERVMYALLEREFMRQQKGEHPMLPLWLSPTHVRLCPINDTMIKYCQDLTDKLSKECIRVDIDDRVESIGKKVRDAELDWIPYTIVIGEKEKKSGKLPLRFRKDGKVRQVSLAGVVKEITKQTKGYPYRPLPLDRLVTKRPVFFG